METKPPNSAPKKKLPDEYLRYSSLGMQMAVVIGLGCYGGIKLDEWLEMKYPIFTIVGILLSLFASMYYLVKSLSAKK